MKNKTVTLSEIQDLKWARQMAEDWKGNFNPDEFDTFDSWIVNVKKAIKSVERDRKLLRSLLLEQEK